MKEKQGEGEREARRVIESKKERLQCLFIFF